MTGDELSVCSQLVLLTTVVGVGKMFDDAVLVDVAREDQETKAPSNGMDGAMKLLLREEVIVEFTILGTGAKKVAADGFRMLLMPG